MNLIKGQEYKVKFSWNKRAVKKIYVGDMDAQDYDTKQYPNGIAEFGGTGGSVFAPYEDIEKIEEVDTTKSKTKKPKTCPRCLGNKTFEHLAHVDGGRCFKCGGTGTI